MSKTKTIEPALFEEPAVAKPAKSKGAVAKVERLPPPEAANMLAIIASAAANPNVDVSKMRELLTMQREIMAEDARIAFTQDFIEMAKGLPSINRDGRITIEKNGRVIQSTPYATFENLHRVIMPVLYAHHFVFWSEPDVGNDVAPIVMRGHLDHIRGHGKTCAIPLPFETSGSKNNVQGIGSSLSYGRRYCLMNLCNIVSHAPEDRDTDGAEEAKTINGSQAKQLIKAIADCGIEGTRFLDKYHITAIQELPLAMFKEAMDSCAAYGERVKEQEP